MNWKCDPLEVKKKMRLLWCTTYTLPNSCSAAIPLFVLLLSSFFCMLWIMWRQIPSALKACCQLWKKGHHHILCVCVRMRVWSDLCGRSINFWLSLFVFHQIIFSWAISQGLLVQLKTLDHGVKYFSAPFCWLVLLALLKRSSTPRDPQDLPPSPHSSNCP